MSAQGKDAKSRGSDPMLQRSAIPVRSGDIIPPGLIDDCLAQPVAAIGICVHSRSPFPACHRQIPEAIPGMMPGEDSPGHFGLLIVLEIFLIECVKLFLYFVMQLLPHGGAVSDLGYNGASYQESAHIPALQFKGYSALII